MFRKVNKVHFVGIGGIGMSGIAELLINQGFEVSGSDLKNSEIINKLEKNGAKINIGHNSDNVADCEVLVYSSAVQKIIQNMFLLRIKKYLSSKEQKC